MTSFRPIEEAALNRITLTRMLVDLKPLSALYTCLYLSGWSQGEIGRQVGCRQQSVSEHVGKAKRILV